MKKPDLSMSQDRAKVQSTGTDATNRNAAAASRYCPRLNRLPVISAAHLSIAVGVYARLTFIPVLAYSSKADAIARHRKTLTAAGPSKQTEPLVLLIGITLLLYGSRTR